MNCAFWKWLKKALVVVAAGELLSAAPLFAQEGYGEFVDLARIPATAPSTPAMPRVAGARDARPLPLPLFAAPPSTGYPQTNSPAMPVYYQPNVEPPAIEAPTDGAELPAPSAEEPKAKADKKPKDKDKDKSAADADKEAKPKSLEKRIEELEKDAKKRDKDEKEIKDDAKKRPSVEFFGRMQIDQVMYNQDADSKLALGDLQNGAEFRRLRLGAKGDLFQVMHYKSELDFSGGDISFKDVYLGISELPWLGTVDVGNFKEPIGMDNLTSANNLTFLERGLPDTFIPGRRLGVMAYNVAESEKFTWAIGAFHGQFDDSVGAFYEDNTTGLNRAESDQSDLAVTGRVTWNPWYDEPSDGRYLLHLGAAGSQRTVFEHDDENDFRFSSKPEAALSRVRFVDTELPIPVMNFTSMHVLDYQLATAEAAANLGSLSLQSEYVLAAINEVGGADLNFYGFYIQGSYFLTGEHRPYDRKGGVFDRVKPFENVFRVRTCDGICSGKGAWELAARWSYIDLDSEHIRGGTLSDATFGVNWYLNPYAKLQFNYIHAFLERDNLFPTESEANVFSLRAQLVF